MAEQIEKDAELLVADFTAPAANRRGLRKLAEGEEPPRVESTERMTPARRAGRIAMYVAAPKAAKTAAKTQPYHSVNRQRILRLRISGPLMRSRRPGSCK